MSEKHMRSRVIQWLRTLNAIAVENPAQPGTPDVNYVEGWIELKKLHKWPKDGEGVVRVDHFTPQQRNWHLLRKRRGGRTHVLLQVADDWLLFDGGVAAMHLGRVSRRELERLALKHWQNGPRAEELRAILAGP
jgi:hypothetical protein